MDGRYRRGISLLEISNRLFFDDELVIESKGSNQGLLDAVLDLDLKGDDKYYIVFDYVVDNQDIRNKYRVLKSIEESSKGYCYSVKLSTENKVHYS